MKESMEERTVSAERPSRIVAESSFLIPEVTVAEPVIDNAIGGESTIVASSVSTSIVAAVPAAEQPVEGIDQAAVTIRLSRLIEAGYQSNRQKHDSDAKSHTEFLGHRN